MSTPRARSPTTSDSANTVHMLETAWGSISGSALKSSSVQPSITAMFCRKRPVPAAHLSFIRKLTTFPSRSRAMALLS